MQTLLLFLTAILNTPECTGMESIRTEYHNIKTEEQLDHFIDLLEEINCDKAWPYMASVIMQKAQYCILPTSKLKYFQTGKKYLETFIQQNPGSIEGRYVRLLVQSEVPGILGYNHDMVSDSRYIKEHIENSGLPKSYQKLILKNVTKATNNIN
ncbi:hypothetical protein [Reichenbachiella sp. MALMAid0571]|uniref:hypothetical protein n=1 Tax=Reichenbachiella sp. MALMAid0571 TaxID=3143939 RepID=UPI0032DEDE81